MTLNLANELRESYEVPVLPLNVLEMTEGEILNVLKEDLVQTLAP